MARSTAPVLAATGIVIANQSLIGSNPVNWKMPIAGGFAVVMLAGIEKVWPEAAVAMAAMLVVGVLFVPINGPSPIENLLSFLQKNGFVSKS